MKSTVKIVSGVLLAGMISTMSSHAAYEVVNCDSDGAFGANSCDQCFNGGTAVVWDNRWLLTDVWDNTSSNSQIVYKEEQRMPEMIPLGGSSWTEVKASDGLDFWQYTPEFDNLYSESDGGYVLNSGQSVTWIESTLWSAYELISSSVPEGQNIGVIAYDISVHDLVDGTVDIESRDHRECVLIKSGIPGETPVNPEQPTQLPKTGPEQWFLILTALLLAFGIFYYRKRA